MEDAKDGQFMCFQWYSILSSVMKSHTAHSIPQTGIVPSPSSSTLWIPLSRCLSDQIFKPPLFYLIIALKHNSDGAGNCYNYSILLLDNNKII